MTTSPGGVGPAEYNWSMGARSAIREIIEHIPNLLGMTRKVTIGAAGQTETIVYTQAQIADLIAATLPDGLKDRGHLLIPLPAIETMPDQPSRRYVRVPITAQPWSDGEVRISPDGRTHPYPQFRCEASGYRSLIDL